MKKYRIIRGKRIHVNQLATESRKRSVKNMTIPKFKKDLSTGEWEHKKYPQPKNLTVFPLSALRPVPTKEDRIRITEELKIKKWEKRHPRPVPENADQKDIFENQFVPEREALREKELQRIRDFVVSVYDKLKLTGRFKKSEDKFEEKQVAELKDNRQEGNEINELDPKKSKLLKKAQKVTNKIAKKDKKLVCTNLKDHKGKKGRIILPKAA